MPGRTPACHLAPGMPVRAAASHSRLNSCLLRDHRAQGGRRVSTRRVASLCYKHAVDAAPAGNARCRRVSCSRHFSDVLQCSRRRVRDAAAPMVRKKLAKTNALCSSRAARQLRTNQLIWRLGLGCARKELTVLCIHVATPLHAALSGACWKVDARPPARPPAHSYPFGVDKSRCPHCGVAGGCASRGRANAAPGVKAYSARPAFVPAARLSTVTTKSTKMAGGHALWWRHGGTDVPAGR